jgi:CYTH domain-containing protein
MAIEIERKFLVRGEEWQKHATARDVLRQAYLASGERSSTRVRITSNADATVTIKSKKTEMRRLEIEYAVSVPDAEALMALRYSGLILADATFANDMPALRSLIWLEQLEYACAQSLSGSLLD